MDGLPRIYTLHLYLNQSGMPVSISNKIQPIDQTSILLRDSYYYDPFSRIISNSGGMYSGVIV
jgi:hypothetical protein